MLVHFYFLMSMGNLHGRPFFGISGETFWRGFGFADLNVGKWGIGDEGEIGRRSREGMEDSAAILCQISSYKDELDLVGFRFYCGVLGQSICSSVFSVFVSIFFLNEQFWIR